MTGLANAIKRVHNDEMQECEAMLIAQAHALQSIFMNFSRRALCQEYQRHLASFFRMAMKAQHQCRMTLETLTNLKNPPLILAKPANIAHGHQQVTVSPLPHAGKKQFSQTNFGKSKMSNGWTQERRARHRDLIQQWKPWEKSTGPKTDKGKAKASANALKHGGRSQAGREGLKPMNALRRQQHEALEKVQ